MSEDWWITPVVIIVLVLAVIGAILGGSKFYNFIITDTDDFSNEIALYGVRASKVNKTTNSYKIISELQVQCLDNTQTITLIRKNYNDRFTVSDTTKNLYEKIYYGISKLHSYKIPDYYLSKDCVSELNSICNRHKECMHGLKSRADCYVNCNVYDLSGPYNIGYPDATFEEQKLYGISVR